MTEANPSPAWVSRLARAAQLAAFGRRLLVEEIFGRVIDGLNIVDIIARAPLRTDDPKLRERPVEPVEIKRAYLSTRQELGLPAKAEGAKSGA